MLDDFDAEPFTARSKTRTIYRRGTGPAVIVVAEMPGITPKVVEFAERVVELGCTAVLPHLFGRPGADPYAAGTVPTILALGSTLPPVCVSREFTVWATGRTSPVVAWLRDLARAEQERCGGPGVGAVGMCFTGGFALGMATDPSVVAPVLSQPSLPFGVTAKQKSTIDVSDADLAKVKSRCAAEGLEVVGLRFRSDRFVPAERFAFLSEQLGESFVAVELDDDDARPGAPNAPHSVLTEHLHDVPGSGSRQALELVLDLFRRKLLAA
ncbi:MAG TPA: dienelactone hydrolase family protein [Acidimicrobiales bacterium]|nr:dienelactone hydrolase family protein [Acidimicrobiales bacterium]